MKYYKLDVLLSDWIKNIAPWQVSCKSLSFPGKDLWTIAEFKPESVYVEKDVVNGLKSIKGVKGNENIEARFIKNSAQEACVSFLKNGVEQVRISEKVSSNPSLISVTLHSDQDEKADLIIEGSYNSIKNEFEIKTTFNKKTFTGYLKGGEHEIPQFVFDIRDEIAVYNPKIVYDSSHEMLYPLIGELYNTDKPILEISLLDILLCVLMCALVDILGSLTGVGGGILTFFAVVVNLIILLFPKNYD